MDKGERLKQLGLELVANHNPDFLKLIRDQAQEIANNHGEVSSDELRRWSDENNVYPKHPNAWGAVFRSNEWKRIGFKKSKYPSNHSRLITIWRYHGK